MVFLPNDDDLAAEGKDIVETVVRNEGRCKITAWREVPVDSAVVGRMAKLTEPRVVQVRVAANCMAHVCTVIAASLHGCHGEDCQVANLPLSEHSCMLCARVAATCVPSACMVIAASLHGCYGEDCQIVQLHICM